MPGISKTDQAHLALLVPAYRGTTEKRKRQIFDSLDLAMVVASRLLVPLYRSRTDMDLPAVEAHCEGKRFRVRLNLFWLAATPLTAIAIKEELKEWKTIGVPHDVYAFEEVTNFYDAMTANCFCPTHS